MPVELTEIGLFAGIGGFQFGFREAGIRTVALVEKDKHCQDVLRLRFPGVPIFDDVCTTGAHNLPWANIVSFGFPCQDLSVAGRRAGLAGGRSGLFFEAARNVYELRPDLAVWENVPGLLSSCSCRRCRRHCQDCGNIAGADEEVCLVCGGDRLRGRVLREHRGADLFTVVSTLGFVGYDGCWTLLDAQYFGVAQRRQRLFGVFARSDIGAACCAQILSLAARMSGDTEASRTKRAGIAASLTAGTASGSGINQPGRRREDDINLVVANSVTASAGHHGYSSPRGDGADNLIVGTLGAAFGRNRGLGQENEVDVLVTEPYTFDWQAGASGDTSFQGKARSWIVDKPGRARALTANRTLAVVEPGERDVATALTAHHGRDAGEDTFVVVPAVAHTLTAPDTSAEPINGKRQDGSRTDRIPIVLSFTERTRGSVRRLTPRECERLQGFPDDWTAEGASGPQSDSVRYRQLGNAVCTRKARWIGSRIVACYPGQEE